MGSGSFPQSTLVAAEQMRTPPPPTPLKRAEFFLPLLLISVHSLLLFHSITRLSRMSFSLRRKLVQESLPSSNNSVLHDGFLGREGTGKNNKGNPNPALQNTASINRPSRF